MTQGPEDDRSTAVASGSRALRWADLAWPEIAALLRDDPRMVGLLPVGATEQHGPHLPTGTDTILAGAICDAVSARTGSLVLPALAVGCSYGHGAEFPGTLSLGPEQLAGVVRQTIEWAARSGLRRFLLVSGHFGNQAALGVATDHLRMWRRDLRTGFTGWWAAGGIATEVFADGEDVHANRAETSLMLAVAPQLVRTDLAVAADDPDRTEGRVFRYTATELSANGVTGRPSEASTALGERLLEAAVAAIAGLVRRGREEDVPAIARDARQATPPAGAPPAGVGVGAW